MQLDAARLLRCMISLAGFTLPLSLLILSACGGGTNSGGSVVPHSPSASGPGVLVSTFAGAANPGADGTGQAARFRNPYNAVTDGINLYVADSANNTIRRIAISTGTVSTLAGKAGVTGAADATGASATFNGPTGIAIDNTKTNLYVVDSGNNKIRQVVISTGAVSSVTGTANTSAAVGAADGSGATATFNHPSGMAADLTTLYVADTGNNKIRRVSIGTWTVSSLTGSANTPGPLGAVDGAPFAASFNGPAGIALDSTRTTLYVADTNNNKIRQVIVSSGFVSSFTGPANTQGAAGAAEGPALSATFNAPFGVATDSANLYVADSSNNKIRQIVISTLAVSSLTGASGVAGTAGFADGATSSATFTSPKGLVVLGSNLYVMDNGNCTIRRIAFGQVFTLAGSALANTGANGTGAAARFNLPGGIASDGASLYVADTGNHTIRQILIATGAVTTLAGQSGVPGFADGAGAAAAFNAPAGITTDGASLFVTDNNAVRRIALATGAVTTLAGTGAAGAVDGAGASATFNSPAGIVIDGANLYVADTGNNKIRTVVIATGAVSSLTGATGVQTTAGAADGAPATASFRGPVGITSDGVNLYVADTGNNKIRKVVIATGAVSSLTGAAGVQATAGAVDGAPASASFNGPAGISTDGVNLYVADSSNNKIRQVAISSGTVSSLTGAANQAASAGFADGSFSAATFSSPYAIIPLSGTFYVTDQGNNTIRRIQ